MQETNDLDIERRVKQVIAEVMNIMGSFESRILTPNAELTGVIGADSLHMVELMMALEDEFDIEINDDDLKGNITIQDLVDIVYAKE